MQAGTSWSARRVLKRQSRVGKLWKAPLVQKSSSKKPVNDHSIVSIHEIRIDNHEVISFVPQPPSMIPQVYPLLLS